MDMRLRFRRTSALNMYSRRQKNHKPSRSLDSFLLFFGRSCILHLKQLVSFLSASMRTTSGKGWFTWKLLFSPFIFCVIISHHPKTRPTIHPRSLACCACLTPQCPFCPYANRSEKDRGRLTGVGGLNCWVDGCWNENEGAEFAHPTHTSMYIRFIHMKGIHIMCMYVCMYMEGIMCHRWWCCCVAFSIASHSGDLLSAKPMAGECQGKLCVFRKTLL